jgi:hypothetical protein
MRQTEAILRTSEALADYHWRHLEHRDLWLTAAAALEVGVIREVGGPFPSKCGSDYLLSSDSNLVDVRSPKNEVVHTTAHTHESGERQWECVKK